MPKIDHSFSAVGAYIFAGGFTLGVREHFNVLCHLEESKYGVATVKKNFPNLPIHVGLDYWPLNELAKKKVDFIYGNPPCAAWSSANCKRGLAISKWRDDPRVDCTRRHFSLLESLRPKVWAWESVTQAYTKGQDFVYELTRAAAELGYSITYVLHDAQWFGLPQVRKRFFMVVHRVNFDLIKPSWEPGPSPLDILSTISSKYNHTPCGSYTRRFGPEILKRVKPGQRLLRFWEENLAIGSDSDKWKRNKDGTVKGRPSFGVARLPLEGAGGAVVGYEMIHPTEHRFISTVEMQVLSGFPPGYTFTPNGMSARACEIARGVCPPVGKWLAKSVSNSLKVGKVLRKPTVTLIDIRKPEIDPVDLTYSVLEEVDRCRG